MVISVLTCINEFGDIESQSLHLTGIEASNLMFKEWNEVIATLDEKHITDRGYSSMSAFVQYGDKQFYTWIIKNIVLDNVTVKFN